MSVRIEGQDCVIDFEGGDAPPVGQASLLLDASDHLVGVDLGGPGFSRVAVMIGAHEDVASQKHALVSVEPGKLRVHGGAAFVVPRRG